MELSPINTISAEEKKELVKKLLQKKIMQKKETHLLSFGQKSLWFLHQNNPDSTSFNVGIVGKIMSAIDVPVLKSVLQRLVNRHAIFRTTYSMENENPVQHIHSFQELAFAEVNAAGWPQETLIEKIREAKNNLFDLENGPVVRFYLFRKSVNESHLLISAHHIAFDGWSSMIFFEELKALYSIVKCGKQSALPDIQYSYINYITKQYEFLSGEEGNKLWKYWEDELKGELPVLNLQTDFPRPAIQTENGTSFKIEFDDETTRLLKDFAKSQGLTTFMLLLGVFKILLYRYTQQDDIIVGTPTAGRSQAEFAKTMGYFVNPVVIRSKFNADILVTDFLKELRSKTMNALSYQDYPFSILVEKLKLTRDPSRTPLFQAMFSFQQYDKQLDMGEFLGLKTLENNEPKYKLQLEPYGISTIEGQVDFAIELFEQNNNMFGYIKYNTDLLKESTTKQMALHFEAILKNILTDPNQKVSQVPILSKSEQQQLLVEFNNTFLKFPSNKCIHELIETQAEESPNHIALIFEDKQLSYQQMNDLSNQLANYLIKYGVNPEDHVGISVDRSLNMVVGMLAILKTGAAYVPLDPSLPNERLSFIASDSGMKLILTQEQHAYKFSDDLHKVCINEQFLEIRGESDQKPLVDCRSENIAYIIYTSGSTGIPKGVMVEHKQVVNFFSGMNEKLGNEQEGTWLALTTFSFDISVQELLWPLTKGFKIVIQDNDLNYLIDSKLPSPMGDLSRLQCEGRGEGNKSQTLDFSLFYFSSSDDINTSNDQENKYKLLFEGAKFADQNGFTAVWTPERHFHQFGGLYPNPSVTGAAIAAITQNVQIRSGSIVAPLHNPLRIAEEWSVVDNISNGRVGLSFASGWQINDFVLYPENYKNRHEIMYQTIETVQSLWKGNAVSLKNSNGNKVETKIFPKPVQSSFPVWITAAGNPDTYKNAGEIGANLLTHLLGQTIEELSEKIKIYKKNWQYKNDANTKPHVTLMLHTFIGKDLESVKQKVYEPFCNYLSSSLDLIKNLGKELGQDVDDKDFNSENKQALLSYAFDRYFQTASLFGTPHSCQDLLDKLLEIGVDEVACLMDFGVENKSVLESFSLLKQLKNIHAVKQKKLLGEYTFSKQIIKHGVTHMQCTPSMIRMLSNDNKSFPALSSLKKLLLGGESLHTSVVKTIFQNSKTEIFNMYGPTETTIWSTCAKINKADEAITIGKPIANTSIYILDKNMQLTPMGVPGEIFIGGSGVTRGYVGKEEMTAERFIKNPFSSFKNNQTFPYVSEMEGVCQSNDLIFKTANNDILYRTGDIGRYLPNGNIEFIGRSDSQIKIRGHRIELGEIELKLSQYKTIKECAVIAKKDNEEYKLLAFVVTTNNEPNDSNELRKYLQKFLPAYMLPSSFIFMKELPLTPNKKIDVKKLQQYSATTEAEKYNPPKTTIEKKLVKIWEDVLGAEKVGVNDNFFDLGGDSILGIQILSKANQAGIKFLPRQLFQYQTIAELAAVAKESRGLSAEQGIITGTVPLSPIQQWFLEQNQEDVHYYNQAVLLEVPSDINIEFIKKATVILLEHHDALRLSFVVTNGLWHEEYKSLIEVIPVYIEDISSLSREEQIIIIEQLGSVHQASLDLSKGNIFRIVLFECGENNTNRLLFVIHHLAVDGISWRILLQDFSTLYTQLEKQAEINLSAKTTSFKEWSNKLIQYSKTEKTNVTYWLEQSSQKVNTIPIDFVVDSQYNTVGSSEKIEIELDQITTQQLLLGISQTYNTQINDILLTALGLAYHQWSGNTKLLLDIEGHGREPLFDDVDITNTVGWFTSVFPVLFEITPSLLGEGWGEGIKSVKETLRNIPANGLEYGIHRYLSDDKQVKEKLAAAPQAEIMFNYLGQTDQALGKNQYFKIAKESVGPYFSPKTIRKHLIEIVGLVQDGKIKFSFIYSKNIYQKDTIQKFAGYFQHSLSNIITHCLSSNTYAYTPSDFPLSGLNQKEIDRIVSKTSEKNHHSSDKRIADMYPLSPMQSGLLFHSLSDGDSNDYLRQFSFSLNGKLNVESFKQSWEKVLERHHILRTAFYWNGTKHPVQLVYPTTPINWKLYNLTNISVKEKEDQIETIIKNDRAERFDLEKAGIVRFILIQLDQQQYKFLWSYHHILLDGWCLPIIFKEVFDTYHSIINGTSLNIPYSAPYRNHIEWVQKQDIVKSEKFWRKELDGFNAPVSFHSFKKISNSGSKDYSEASFQFSPELTGRLEQLAKENRITSNTIFQAAWAILLSKYCGEQDVAFGSIVSGRPPELEGVETMMGLFINNIPVRIKIESKQLVQVWLKELYEKQLERDQYTYCSLSDIQKWSNIPNGQPLFDSIIAFENYPMDAALGSLLKDVELKDVHFPEPTNYPITLFVIPGKSMSAKISFNKNSFDKETITQLLSHYATIINEIINKSNQAVSTILMIDAEEKKQLLSINPSVSYYPQNKCIHEIFEEQLQRYQNKVALKFKDREITFTELNTQANKLAHFLTKNGVETEKRVGVYLDRSIEMIVAVLGILKAGGVYVPVDINDPKERIEFILQDTGTSVLISTANYKEKLSFYQNTLIAIDEAKEIINTESCDNIPSTANANNLAYIMYTSGSTGKPKGVCIEHKSVVRLVRDTNYFTVNESEVFLQFAPLAFDASTFEIWAPLLNNSTLVIAPPGKISLEEIGSTIKSSGVSSMWLTSGLFNIMVDECIDDLNGLDQLLIGGDVLSIKHVNKFIDHNKTCKLINGYGPTENTTFTCFYPITEKITSTASVPVGRPISNTQVYILDNNMNLLPIGIPGELYAGGDGLARCYLNQPELTKEKFVKNPFADSEESVLYKTGDIARYLPDGNIELLGRKDNQIKITGHRVELEEIQAIINQYSEVIEAVVLAEKDLDGHKKIVAFIQFHDGAIDRVESLRKYLKERMPDYMIPATLIEVNEFPLLSSGKVDRRVLAKQAIIKSDNKNNYVEPANNKEKLLAKIWSEVLNVNKVGIKDNFFELGGDSILAIQIISKINQHGYKLNPSLLFQCQTIEEVATIIKEEKSVQAEQGVVEGNVPFMPIQQWFFEQNLKDPNHFNQAVMLEVPSTINVGYIAQAFEKLIEHHDALRSKYFKEGNKWTQEILPATDNFLIETEDLSELSIEEQKNTIQHISDKSHQSLNLQNAKLIKVVLFHLGNDQSARLLIIIHHLVIDGVSWRILMEDLFSAYTTLLNNQKIVLPKKTTSFKEWANKVKEYSNVGNLETEINYWKKVVEHKTNSLPVDFINSSQSNTAASSKQFSIALNETNTQQLLKQIPTALNVQMNDVLLTALSVAFYKWTGRNEIKIDLEGHGRENLFDDVDISRTIGWFTTKYPVVLSLNNSIQINEALTSINKQLKNIPNSGIGYGLIRYLLNEPPEEIVNSVMPEVVFNYLGQTDQALNTQSNWKPAKEPSGEWKNKNELRSHLIEINAIVVNQKLEIIWTYSDYFHRSETIEKLANDYKEFLETIIESSNTYNLPANSIVDYNSNGAKSLVPFRKTGKRPPLFFVPGAGGNVMYLQKLSQYLGNDQPFYGLQAVGIDGKTEPLKSIEDIAQHYVNEMIDKYPEGPYHIAGHSFGSWIAFEMANQLSRQGRNVEFLGIVDMYAPQTTELRESSTWNDDSKWYLEIAEMIHQMFNVKIELSYAELNSLSPHEQLALVKKKLEDASVLPMGSDPSLLTGLMNVQKTNSKIYYFPKECISTDITLIRAEEEAESHADFKFSKHFKDDPALGWNKFSKQTVHVTYLKGNHLSIMKDPYVSTLAEKLNSFLHELQHA